MSDAVADLHVHTTNSDGSLDLAEVPARARAAGLDAAAITDHDRVHPDLDAPVTVVDGVTLIHGIELKVDAEERVDLLGYGVEPTAGLREELDRLQRDRRQRGAAIIERVEEHLGIDLDIEAREGIGRPHIARAVADHPETDYDVQGVFDDLIADGRPCYVARDLPSFERGRELLAEACALVGIAHPLRYDDPGAALERARSLDAVERWYPYEREVDPAPVERAIAEGDLLATGGSDAHDEGVGRVAIGADAYGRVRERLPAPP